jgi:hypothetical protein
VPGAGGASGEGRGVMMRGEGGVKPGRSYVTRTVVGRMACPVIIRGLLSENHRRRLGYSLLEVPERNSRMGFSSRSYETVAFYLD